MTPECKVKKMIDKKLEELDAYWFNPVPYGFGKNGIPDKIACVPVEITYNMVGAKVGVFVGIEAKAGVNKTTMLQDRQLDAIRKAKGKSFIVRDKESLDKAVEEVLTFNE